MLHIQLLGEFRLTYGDTIVNTLSSPRLQSLVAYLLLHRHAPQSRNHLAFLFWPDSTEAQAQTNLRQLLHHLRHALPEASHFLSADTKTLQWQPEAPFTLDVAEFEARVAQADQTKNQGVPWTILEEAVALYKGDLLPNCYEEWLLTERERLSQRYLRTLEQLIEALEEQHDYRSALRYTQRLLRHDPLHETTYRWLMRLHALNNDRASALRVYHTCVTILQRELDVEPSQATQEAYERLRAGAQGSEGAVLRPPGQPKMAQAQDVEKGGDLRMELPLALPPTTSTPFLPLVGRQPEWQTLITTWRSTAQGQAHFVLIAGEAGIGKTRLAEEFLEWITQQGIATTRTRSYAAEGRLAYAPVIDWLRSTPFWAALPGLDEVWLTEVVRLLPELLIGQPHLPRPEPLTDGWQRQRLFEALARAIFIIAGRQPLLLVIDDLQWTDQETLEWLRYLIRFSAPTQLLIVGTVRSEEVGSDHPLNSLLLHLQGLRQLTEIQLGPLDETETTLLAERVAGQALTSVQTALLYQETEGHPLFVVEMVRANLYRQGNEQGFRTQAFPPALPPESVSREAPGKEVEGLLLPSPTPLPPHVQAVIQARLAQLSPSARELAHLAATIGRAFTFEALAQASDSDENTLVRSLDELWQRRLVREQGADAYDFSHDKIREVAYAEISTARRRQLHRRVAQALETIYASHLEPVSSQIAAHYEQAGLPQPAIAYYQRAAGVAQHIYANQETIEILTKALILLKTLPASQEQDEKEFGLHLALGVSLVALKGYGAIEVVEVYTRARALYQKLGKAANPPILRALAIAYVVRGEFREAHELGAQLLSLAQSQQDPILWVEGHYVLGVTLFWLGEFIASRTHLEQALAHYNPNQRSTHLKLYAQDPEVICLGRLAWTLWYLGYPDQAVQRMQEALRLGKELSHPYTLAYTLFYVSMLYHNLHDVQSTAEQAEALVTLCHKQQFGYMRAMGTILRSWAIARQGEVELGITQMRQGLVEFQAAKGTFIRPCFLALLAELSEEADNIKQSFILLDEALAAVNKNEERWYEAEVIRLKGTLLLKTEAKESAEAHFHQAIEIARRQGTKSLELRATMSLSRLWWEQGRKEEARQLLSQIYNWFTEGLETADLQEARRLLTELAC